MVYLITCETNNTCKIGYSNNPEKRLSELQVGNPYPLRISSVLKGNILLEKQLHKKHSDFRLKGEWFLLNDEIKKDFESNNNDQLYYLKTIINFDVESSYGVMIDFYNVRLETDKEYNDRIGHENNQREYEIKRLTDRINILKNER